MKWDICGSTCGSVIGAWTQDNERGDKVTEQDNSLRFTIYIDTYGNKARCVRSVGQTLARLLYTAFGDRFRMVDHRSQPIEFDPAAHDWGFGET